MRRKRTTNPPDATPKEAGVATEEPRPGKKEKPVPYAPMARDRVILEGAAGIGRDLVGTVTGPFVCSDGTPTPSWSVQLDNDNPGGRNTESNPKGWGGLRFVARPHQMRLLERPPAEEVAEAAEESAPLPVDAVLLTIHHKRSPEEITETRKALANGVFTDKTPFAETTRLPGPETEGSGEGSWVTKTLFDL